ncbi:MAG: methyltransferase domain-containing protein [Bacteroidetes bacterium]|nr:methyltransferase domain-containing protein [Bacteroidota bacterium]MBS1628734.1 methyltransferase domain-containing protein [Bacteroidota bacterium]
MRAENLPRLNYFKTNFTDPNYLHFTFLFRDVAHAVSEHGRGAVLDVGCGNKPYEPLFTQTDSYFGCDVIQSSEHKVDLLCLSTEIPLPDQSFDTVFSTQVLEHVEDHLKMLQESYRLLKPGGKIILSAPMVWEHHEVPYDFFRFTRYGLQYIMEKAGFEVVNIKPNGGKWAALGQLKQSILTSSLKNKKGFIRKVLYLLYRYSGKYAINIIYKGLDNLDHDEDFVTTNFIVVALKH